MAVDAGLALLNRFGYNLVQRHDCRLAPLDVLGRDDVLERVAPLSAVFTSTRPLPELSTWQPVAAFNGQRTDSMHVSLASRLLANIVNGLGGGAQVEQVDALMAPARFVRFEFEAVGSESVNPAALLHYLTPATPCDPKVEQRFLNNPDADALVVSGVLSSGHVRFQPLEYGNTTVPLDLPRLQGALGVETNQQDTWIQCRGRMRATLAFQCYWLAQTSSGWSIRGMDAAPDLTPVLIATGTRLLVWSSSPPAQSPPS